MRSAISISVPIPVRISDILHLVLVPISPILRLVLVPISPVLRPVLHLQDGTGAAVLVAAVAIVLSMAFMSFPHFYFFPALSGVVLISIDN